jgi:hypothetical protein
MFLTVVRHAQPMEDWGDLDPKSSDAGLEQASWVAVRLNQEGLQA